MVILIQVGGSPFVQLCAGERHRGEREQMNQPQTYAESESFILNLQKFRSDSTVYFCICLNKFFLEFAPKIDSKML